jgi:DNA-binding MarR family transcriptional regulator
VNNAGTKFVDEPLAKRSDPRSSDMAAEAIHKSGHIRTQRQRVLECLRKNDYSTGAELGRILAGDRYAAHRRLAELERMGLVARAGFRKCRVTRRRCQVWRAVSKEFLFNEMEARL